MKEFKGFWKIPALIIALWLVNLAVQSFDVRLDLSVDRRYTLHPDIKSVLRHQDEEIDITVLLEGNIPPSFKHLTSYLEHYLGDLSRFDNNIVVDYLDMTEATIEESQTIKEILTARGLSPMSRTIASADQVSKSLIFPFVLVSTRSKVHVIDILDNKSPDQSEEEAIQTSIKNFPVKLFSALSSLLQSQAKNIVVLGKSNRLIAEALNRETTQLDGYRFAPIDGSTWLSLPDSILIDGFLMLGSGDGLSRADMLAADQALQKHIAGIYLLDKARVHLDSFLTNSEFFAQSNDFLVEDQLIKWGIRINPSIVQGLPAGLIPQVAGTRAGDPNIIQVPFDYHLVLGSSAIAKDLSVSQQVAMYFASSLDTIRTATDVNKNILITTSELSKVQSLPLNISLNKLRVEPDVSQYEQTKRILGIQVKGPMQSLFNQRLTSADIELLAGNEFTEATSEGHVIVVSDADFLFPMRDERGAYFPIGYNKWEEKLYEGNVALMKALLDKVTNAPTITLLGEEGKYSPIDKKAFYQNKNVYALYILGAWLIGIILVSLVQYGRRRKYNIIDLD